MADEQDRLTANPDDQQEPVVEAEAPVAPEGAPSEALTEDQVSSMIAAAQEQAIREVEEKALRQAQSLSDKTEARLDKKWRRDLGSALAPYEEALAERGAEPGELEDLRKYTEEQLEVRRLKSEIERYKRRDEQQQAQLDKEKFIAQTCAQFGLNPFDPRLKRDAPSPDEFLTSAMAAWQEDQTKGLKATKTDKERERLEAQVAAGALDVTGGGAAMSPPAWSTSKLVAGSDESIISSHIIHYFGSTKPEEMGRLLRKTQELMKHDPKFKGRLKESVRRIYDQETLGK